MKNDHQCHRSFFRLLFIALLLTALFGFTSSMAEISTGTCGPDLTWTLDESGTLTISGSGEMNDFSSPSYAPWYENRQTITSVTVDGNVTKIGKYAFYMCTNLTSVILPDSVLTIDYYSFANCYSLVSINMPASLTSISQGAFYQAGLTGELTIPEGITCISRTAFFGTNLSSINWNENITTIERGAFERCRLLTTVSIPSSVINLGDEVFRDCSGLISITIPESISSIGSGVFTGCESLASLTIPNSVHSISDYAFRDCSSLKKLTIPGTVSTIGAYAFSNCTSLKQLEILEGVTSIGNSAFSYCSSLERITVPYSVNSIGDYAFSSLSDENVKDIYYAGTQAEWALLYRQPLSFAIIHADIARGNWNGINWILDCQGTLKVDGNGTIKDNNPYNTSAAWLANKTQIYRLVIGDGITQIGSHTFSDCPNLSNVTFPSTLTSISSYAFDNCNSLADIYYHGMQNGWDSIYISSYGNEALSNASLRFETASGNWGSLHWILNEHGVLTVSGSGAMNGFNYNSSLAWNQYKTSIQQIIIEEGVTSIGTFAFYSCYSVQSIQLPLSLTKVDASNFASNNLKNVIYHGTSEQWEDVLIENDNLVLKTTTINCLLSEGIWGNLSWTLCEDGELIITGQGPMNDLGASYSIAWANRREQIQKVTINDGVTSIGENAFYFSQNLTEITIPESIRSIGAQAFTGCFNLTHIIIPNGVTTIGNGAFERCGVSSFIIPESVISVGVQSFSESAHPIFLGRNPFASYNHPRFSLTVPHGDVSWNSLSFDNYTSFTMDRHCPEHLEDSFTAVLAAKQEATCTESGHEEYWHCPYCGIIFTSESADSVASLEDFTITPLGHIYSIPIFIWEEDDTVCSAKFTCVHGDDEITVSAEISTPVSLSEPDCTETGLSELTATVQFSAVLSEEALAHAVSDPEDENLYQFSQTIQHTIPALGHTPFVSLSAVEPNCTKSGRTEEIICDVCGEPLQESTALPALGHHYLFQQAVWDETHTACQMIFECERCSDQIQEAAQIETEVLLEATCTEAGATRWTATLDYEGETYTDTVELNVPEALGHTIAIDPAVPQTDRETGLTEGSHCSVCGEILTAQKIIPANWSYSDDGLTVTAYNGTETDLTIPKGVTHLGNTLFKDNTNVTSVTVPDGVTVLGSRTFYGASALQDVYLSPSVAQLYSQTFFNTDCRIHTAPGSSTAVQLAIRGLRFEADENWTLLQRAISSEEGITATAVASYNGTATEIIIPDEFGNCPVTELLSGSFADHPSLISLTVPDTVTVIEEGTFAQDHHEIVIRSTYTAYAREWALENGYIWEHSSHTEQLIPGKEPTCTEDGLSDGRICSECGKILAEQEVLPALGHQPELIPAVPATMTHTGLTEGSRCSVCGEILTAQEIIQAWGPMDDPDFTLPAQLKLIEDEALSNIAAEVIFIPNGVLSIGSRAFSGCSSLRQIYIPSSVTEFGESIFEGCSIDLLIYGENGSPAETWAEQNGLLFVRMP